MDLRMSLIEIVLPIWYSSFNSLGKKRKPETSNASLIDISLIFSKGMIFISGRYWSYFAKRKRACKVFLERCRNIFTRGTGWLNMIRQIFYPLALCQTLINSSVRRFLRQSQTEKAGIAAGSNHPKKPSLPVRLTIPGVIHKATQRVCKSEDIVGQ